MDTAKARAGTINADGETGCFDSAVPTLSPTVAELRLSRSIALRSAVADVRDERAVREALPEEERGDRARDRLNRRLKGWRVGWSRKRREQH